MSEPEYKPGTRLQWDGGSIYTVVKVKGNRVTLHNDGKDYYEFLSDVRKYTTVIKPADEDENMDQNFYADQRLKLTKVINVLRKGRYPIDVVKCIADAIAYIEDAQNQLVNAEAADSDLPYEGTTES